jgi:N-acetylglucosaminyldiphosphoundecaprenol N-acetyl-beta-D-mannosaminyltransferase
MVPATLRKPFILLGVPIDAYNFSNTVSHLLSLVEAGRASGKSYQAATVNTDFLVNSVRDGKLFNLLHHVDWATADGMPVIWAARLLGIHAPERVAGADLVPALAERAAQKGFSIYFYGAAPGVAQRAADILKQRFPGVRVAGVCSPPFTKIEQTDPEIIEAIRAASPDILFVALGHPKQERWIQMYREKLGVPLLMGVGASLDFLAGEQKRAPLWMQQIGLEWLFRLLQEPRRLWQRYFVDMVVFSVLFARQWWSLHPKRISPSNRGRISWRPNGSESFIHLSGVFTSRNVKALQAIFDEALSYSPRLIIDAAGVRFLDSAVLGLLSEAAKQALKRGGALTLVDISKPLANVLSQLRLDRLFQFQNKLTAPRSQIEATDYSTAV